MSNQDSSSSKFVGYVNDPDGRGTPSLVISCLVTLVLCVWSAVHLNVPPPGQTKPQALLLIARWIVAGIYAPELVVFVAWRQWSSARILQRTVDATLGKQSKGGSNGSNRRSEWTMAHSFFACAGGFAFELDGLKNAIHGGAKGESQRVQRLTITAKGIALLAECGALPDIEAEQIEDKSKANDLAKATVLIQATWMLVQSIGRLASRLPVTLLEVNTVAHVLCAFLMYSFWWHKPLLPQHPIVLRDDDLAPLAAFMYSSSEISGYVNPKRVKSKTIVKTFFAYLNLYSKTPELESICLRSREPNQRTPAAPEQVQEVVRDGKVGMIPEVQLLERPSYTFRESPTACMEELRARSEKEKGTTFFERRAQVHDKRPHCEESSKIERIRWDLMSCALSKHPNLLTGQVLLTHKVDMAEDGGPEHKTCQHLKPEQLVADHIQNWPSSDLLRDVGGLVVGMVLWFANLCYGAIHVAAWNDHFPSTAEKWLWRASASYIAFCGGLWVVLNFVVAQVPRLNDFWETWMDGEKTSLESVGLGLVVFICGFSLVIARIFVVVEAFVSIRELPVEAYMTPEWTNIFPHF